MEEVYDLPELYMEIFWEYLKKSCRDYSLTFSDGFAYSTLPHFSLVHLKFKRPPKGKNLSNRQVSKITRESKRREDSLEKPFSERTDFEDEGLLEELADMAKQVCGIADRVLGASADGLGVDGVLKDELGKRKYLKGERCWAVVEPTKDAGTRLDQDGVLHVFVQIRSIQPPAEWLERRKNGRRWWTESMYKEKLSVDDTWSMVSDFGW